MHPEYVKGWRAGVYAAKNNLPFAAIDTLHSTLPDIYWDGYRDGWRTIQER